MADPVSTAVSLLGREQGVPWEALAVDEQTTLQAALAVDPPKAVLYPESQEQLAEVVACAGQQGWRLLPCGSGTKLAWGGLVQGVDWVVSTARLNRVVEHAVGDLTLTAESGVRLADLQSELAKQQQFLAIDPLFPERATLGGIVATANTGSLRQRYGGVRDQLIGITFVRHDGRKVKAGGRVVKNVAGYDLMKLMTGAYGTLGIITEMTLRTYPTQAASQTVVLTGTAAAVQACCAAVRMSPLTPVSLDLLSSAWVRQVSDSHDEMALAVRFQSIPAGVEEQSQRLLELVAPGLTGTTLTAQADQALWQTLVAPTATVGDPWITAKVGILPTEAVNLLTQVDQLTAGQGYAKIHAGSGVGMVWLAQSDEVETVVRKLRSHCEVGSGYLTLLHAPLALKQAVDVWGYVGNSLDLMRRLKQQFDPRQCLSPGRFIGDL